MRRTGQKEGRHISVPLARFEFAIQICKLIPETAPNAVVKYHRIVLNFCKQYVVLHSSGSVVK
jgi:hypothetical protein